MVPLTPRDILSVALTYMYPWLSCVFFQHYEKPLTQLHDAQHNSNRVAAFVFIRLCFISASLNVSMNRFCQYFFKINCCGWVC